MAFDSFLEFAGPIPLSGGSTKVVGESIDKAHPATVQLVSFEFGIENSVTIASAAGGAGTGKAAFQTLQIVKSVDSASANLFAASGMGAHFPQVNLYVRKSGTGSDYLVYRFKLVFVSKISWSGSSGDAQPSESIELTFGAMQVSYATQLPTGQVSPTPIVQTWNQVTNKPDFAVPGVP
jgi:type VI secretion system secreted protein Hcp